jgi:hypothetical protein
LYTDNLPRTLKQLPINRGCSRQDFSASGGALELAAPIALVTRKSSTTMNFKATLS